jgi:hypothetical protein
LTNNEAAVLAQSLLTPGPRPPASASPTAETPATANAPQRGRAPVLEQSAYVDLLSSVIDSALKATPPSQANRGAAAAPRPMRAPGVPAARPNQGTGPTENQNEQNNARRLLAGLQVALPTIDQYLPAKAPMVRQKLTEMGLSNNSPLNMAQTFSALQGNLTADALIQAASTVPPQMQTRLYQQAAFTALEEGNADRARQIATEHLPVNMRDSVMQRIEFRELAKKAETTRFEEIRQTLNRLQSDNEKIDLLLQVAKDAQKTNPKLALQLLEEAKQMTSRRATNYDHFEQQLRVARAFSTVDPARSFEVLDPGISQLNELLSAAAVLNGFEMNMFRDGEMSMQGGNGLTATISRYGRELAALARVDLERSETLAGRFQFTESRIMARMSIVQGLLDVRQSQEGPNINNIRGLGQNFNILRPE